jgi:hypothetical protein
MPYSIANKEKTHMKSSLCMKGWRIAIQGNAEQENILFHVSFGYRVLLFLLVK